MTKKIIIVTLMLLFIVGCKGGGKDTPVSRDDIFKGTEGLVFNFLKNAPPLEIYSSTDDELSQFSIVAELENKGGYDIKEDGGYLTLVLEDDYMAVDEWQEEEYIYHIDESQIGFSLEGKSMLNPIGGRLITTIKVNSKKFPEILSETHESSVLLTACYKYQTNVFENVCIDTDVYNLKNLNKPCKLKDLSLSSQGAPIVVPKVEVEMLPHENEGKIKPLFTIHAENRGTGEVIRENMEVVKKACSSESLNLKENDLNVIFIKAYLSGKEYQLDCNPKLDGIGYIRLREKQGTARCGLKEGKDKEYGTYESPLIIELYYGYMETIGKQITIKKPVTY